MSTPEHVVDHPSEPAIVNNEPNEQTDGQLEHPNDDNLTEPVFRVVIKNPTDRPGNVPFSLSLAPTTTIAALKETLSTKYPGNPAASSQRLIHAGKLLTDAATLSAILPPDMNATHTIHLVVSTRTSPSAPAPSSTSTNPAPLPNPPLPYPPNRPQLPPHIQNLPYVYNPYYYAPYPIPHPPPPSDVPPHPPHLDNPAYAQHLHAVEHLIAHALNTLPQNVNDPEQRAQIAAHLDAAAAALHGHPPPHPHAHAQPHQHHHHDHHDNQNNVNQHQHQPPNQPQQNPLPNNAMGVDLRFHRHNAPRVRHFVFQFELNWALIAKLAFLVYLLSQEGNATRVYLLIAIALGVYLWRLGHLRFLRGLLSSALPSPRRFVGILFPARAPRFARARVALSFVYSFVYGFFCSLLPAWNPERIPDVTRLAQPAEDDPASQPQAAEQPHEQPHEHAD